MKTIVIGSGFRGIAAAIRLKSKGHQVTLIEKNNDLGGRARVFERNGFKFDGGPTKLLLHILFMSYLNYLIKKYSDYIKIQPLDIWYRFLFEDGYQFDYSGNEKSMINQIEKINKKDVEK